MAVKNGADTLDRSIGSIINQTFGDWELIVCDDGSDDETLSILKNYSEKDHRIQYLHNDTCQGSAQARNVCIERAKADIIAVQDADDRSDVTRLAKQYDFMMSHPEFAIVGTAHYNVFNEGEYMKVSYHQEFPTAKDQIKGGRFMHPSFMMRKAALESVGCYTVSPYTLRSQDYHMVMKMLGAGYKMCNIQEPLYYYYVDDNTIGRSMNWKRVKGLMWIRWDAYRRNRFPFWTYIYCLKPLITNLIPSKIMRRHYEKVYGKK